MRCTAPMVLRFLMPPTSSNGKFIT
jgi:hypothetical protein